MLITNHRHRIRKIQTDCGKKLYVLPMRISRHIPSRNQAKACRKVGTTTFSVAASTGQRSRMREFSVCLIYCRQLHCISHEFYPRLLMFLCEHTRVVQVSTYSRRKSAILSDYIATGKHHAWTVWHTACEELYWEFRMHTLRHWRQGVAKICVFSASMTSVKSYKVNYKCNDKCEV